MSERIQGRDGHAAPASDAGARARHRVGAAGRRGLARRVVDRGQRMRAWVRGVLLCKAAILFAALLIE